MATEFTIGDTAPQLRGSVNADLTGVTSLTAHVRRPDATVFSKQATADAGTAGGWKAIAWSTTDLNQSGYYNAELEVHFSDGSTQTFGPAEFHVRDQFA